VTVEGKKYDEGKTRFDLLPRAVLEGVARVMTFGAKRYGDYNWQHVELPRYLSAMERHLMKALSGEHIDADSGEHHAYHFCCNAVFITWLLLHKPSQVQAYVDAQDGKS
jgi:hypothetical protein